MKIHKAWGCRKCGVLIDGVWPYCNEGHNCETIEVVTVEDLKEAGIELSSNDGD